MPFALAWSPRPNWFFVNHHAGSFMQVPEVFEITATGVVKHDKFLLGGAAEARRQFPCLAKIGFRYPNGDIVGWSQDGRKVAWVLMTRLDVCMGPADAGPVPPDKQVEPLFLISDVDTGEVMPDSVVVWTADDDAEEFSLPNTAAYRDIVRLH
jgi:hypothetical protein